MTKNTLDTVQESIDKLAKSVKEFEVSVDKRFTKESQGLKEFIVEYVSEEIQGLAFMVAKTEMKLMNQMDNIETGLEQKIDNLRKDMSAGFDRLDKTKISYNTPIKVKKSTKTL